ncbi:MAG: TerB family tellurite resistance protein [Bacteroidetes bacterium]|nr:TerB family tellurite resistance protein [Bacteroidota bacterium]
MNPITFDKLLLKTAFCCMASDGHIDNREISLIKKMCNNSPLFKDFDFQSEINNLVNKINTRGLEFISYYFSLLDKAILSEQEELILIDFAVQTINADEKVEYAEIKFFKNIRHRLKVSDVNILAVFPDIEQFLEEDIVTESFLDKITNQYLETAEFPQFDVVNIDTSIIDNLSKNE